MTEQNKNISYEQPLIETDKQSQTQNILFDFIVTITHRHTNPDPVLDGECHDGLKIAGSINKQAFGFLTTESTPSDPSTYILFPRTLKP